MEKGGREGWREGRRSTWKEISSSGPGYVPTKPIREPRFMKARPGSSLMNSHHFLGFKYPNEMNINSCKEEQPTCFFHVESKDEPCASYFASRLDPRSSFGFCVTSRACVSQCFTENRDKNLPAHQEKGEPSLPFLAVLSEQK
jgi:hypothetical protein